MGGGDSLCESSLRSSVDRNKLQVQPISFICILFHRAPVDQKEGAKQKDQGTVGKFRFTVIWASINRSLRATSLGFVLNLVAASNSDK